MARHNNLPRPVLVVLVWLGLAFVFGTYAYLNLAFVRKWPPPFVGFGVQFIHFATWGLLSLPILALLRYFPLTREKLWRSLLVHIPVSALIGLAHVVLFVWLVSLARLHNPATNIEQRLQMALTSLPSSVLTYWVFAGAAIGYSYYRRYAERDLQVARLETQLAETKLRVLKMQLDPHFLFNTLNSISALMRRDIEAADAMLEGLSQLLRMSLAHEAQQEVTLREELEFLELYLAIQQSRFRDKLAIEMDIDPEALDALVPHMILQPAVENALQHAVSAMVSDSRISVAARRTGTSLVMTISDNGPGFAAEALESPQGVGLQNTRRRLEALYAGEFGFNTRNAPGGGAVVRMELPFRLPASCAALAGD
jgi:sensor histidine kinase YesM